MKQPDTALISACLRWGWHLWLHPHHGALRPPHTHSALSMSSVDVPRTATTSPQKMQESFMTFARCLSYAIDAKDTYTHGHSLRVTEHALGLARTLRLAPPILEVLEVGGLLHDIGKIGIPEKILHKKGPLSNGEFDVIKRHPSDGARMLGELAEMAHVALCVRHHHERFDGTGYPDGLAGDSIPLTARILAVADAYDAITSERPYRKALGRRQAVEELRRCSGTQFDPRLVDLFIPMVENRPKGRIESALRLKYPSLKKDAPTDSSGALAASQEK